MDPRSEARTVAVGHAFERTANERVARKPRDTQLGRAFDGDSVGERNALVDRNDLVLPVLTRRTDDERQVDLGRGGCARHFRASVSMRNS